MAEEPDAPPAFADPPSRRPLGRRGQVILLLLALLVIGGGALWVADYRLHGRYLQETDDATVEADETTVAPRVNGYVQQVLVADNQDVQVGQPLVRIDARDYGAQVAQAEARITQVLASVQGARALIGEQEAAVAQARAQLEAARSRAAHDAAEVRRVAPLVAAGAERRDRLLQFKAAAAQTAADVHAFSAALVKQQRRTVFLMTEAEQAEAQVKGARAQLSAARIGYGATVIRAAIAGRVGDRTVTVGQYVQAGTRLMTLVPLDRLYVVANFKETQLAQMRPGQHAEISIDAMNGASLHGRVESFSPGTGARFSLVPPNNATGNFTKIVQRVPVRISITASPEALRSLVPGLSATVTVDTQTRVDPPDPATAGLLPRRSVRIVQDIPDRRSPQRRRPDMPSGRPADGVMVAAADVQPFADRQGSASWHRARQARDVGR